MLLFGKVRFTDKYSLTIKNLIVYVCWVKFQPTLLLSITVTAFPKTTVF